MKTTETEYRSALTEEGERVTRPCRAIAAEVEYREIVGRSNVGRIMIGRNVEHRQTSTAPKRRSSKHRGLNAQSDPARPAEAAAARNARGHHGADECRDARATGDPCRSSRAGDRRVHHGVGPADRRRRVDRRVPDFGSAADRGRATRRFSTAVDDETDPAAFSSSLLQSRVGSRASYFVQTARRRGAVSDAIDMALAASAEWRGSKRSSTHELIAGAAGLLRGYEPERNHAAGATVTAFADYLEMFAHGRVDGRYGGGARGRADASTGSASYAHMGGSVPVRTNADYSARSMRSNSKTGGVRVSAHVPDVSSGNKQNAVIRHRLARPRGHSTVLWDGVTIFVTEDEIGARVKTGEIAITAILLVRDRRSCGRIHSASRKRRHATS